MDYKEFRDIVKQAHGGNAKYAKYLYLDCRKPERVTVDLIPCMAWCLLEYKWPQALARMIDASEALSNGI